jgi:hypothetical protein
MKKSVKREWKCLFHGMFLDIERKVGLSHYCDTVIWTFVLNSSHISHLTSDLLNELSIKSV